MTSESNACHQTHRPISAQQIAQLIGQGCSCDDWSNVKVAADFIAETVKFTRFSGEVKLGTKQTTNIYERLPSLVHDAMGGVSRLVEMQHERFGK